LKAIESNGVIINAASQATINRILARRQAYRYRGQLILTEKVPFTEPMTVIVTFLEEPKKILPKKLELAQFSFAQSREMLKNVKGSLSDALIEERRSAL
jgi:hypothetical protein